MSMKYGKNLSFTEKVFKKVRRVWYGVDTPTEFLLSCVNKIFFILSGKNLQLAQKRKLHRIEEKFVKGDVYHIKNVRLPLPDMEGRKAFLGVLEDTFYSYLYWDDSYDEKIVDLASSILDEGGFGLKNSDVNVVVEPKDVVIDAGSWIGDFAAYASQKGATVYAFEPLEETFKYLCRTAKLNSNIIPVKVGLSNESVHRDIFCPDSTLGASFIESRVRGGEVKSVATMTLDEFVQENKLEKVDFIKSDIEGSERYLLMGAQETLRRFAPKLALCTYHLPDDPKVMANLIKSANPNYRIIQKRCKLYASVPK